MEFNQKLQELRKRKGLTQEELAESLYVSRTAVSKWESGRGYPNIDSLKAIAKFFSVTVDELLSGDELLNAVQEENKQKEAHLCGLVFGLLDVSSLLLFFLPFFSQKSDGEINAVSLLMLNGIGTHIRIAYFVVVILLVLFGITVLAVQNCNHKFSWQIKSRISLILNSVGTFLFIVSPQPYAAAFMFVLLIIKMFIVVRQH